MEQRRHWATRILHEASLHEQNSFITLTYDDGSLPVGGTLVKHHFQDFMKRLRARLSPRKIRFFQCGEYGDRYGRPHYHAIIFGYDFPDRVLYSKSKGEPLYVSRFLDSVWNLGLSTVGDVTFDSAAYVAGYCLKKLTGELRAEGRYSVDERTGELHEVEHEYATMSNRPGIGADWLEKFSSDCYPRDELPIPGRGVYGKPPRYYDVLFERNDAEGFERIKKKRRVEALRFEEESTAPRLAAMEKCAKARQSLKEKSL